MEVGRELEQKMKRKEKGRVPTHWFTPQRPGPLHRQQRLNFFSCYLLHSSVHTKEKIEPGAEQVLQPWSSDMPSRNAKWCINPCTKYSPLHFPLYQSICKWDASAYGLLWRVSEILNLSAQISLKILPCTICVLSGNFSVFMESPNCGYVILQLPYHSV